MNDATKRKLGYALLFSSTLLMIYLIFSIPKFHAWVDEQQDATQDKYKVRELEAQAVLDVECQELGAAGGLKPLHYQHTKCYMFDGEIKEFVKDEYRLNR